MKPETEAKIRAAIEAERARSGYPPAAAGRFAEFGQEPLPVDEYLDPKRYELELERVFRRAWLPVARSSELGEAGAFATVDVARDPLAVVRGEDGALLAFHNVCRHRAAQVLREESGVVEALVCPYHGFRYGLDGRLRSCTDPDSFPAAFDPAAVRLPPVKLDEWGGWAWITLDGDAPPLVEFLGELTDELANWDFAEAVLVARETHEVEFGWKVGVEAFLEPYHLPSIHAGSAHPLLDFRASAMDWFGPHSRMATAFRAPNAYAPDGPMGREAAELGVEGFARLNQVQRTTNMSYLVFPATVFSLLPNHFTVFRMLPEGIDRTRFVYELYAAPSASERAGEFYASLKPRYARLLEEDFENLPWIQRGVRDSATTGVPLSHHERRIRHFRAEVRKWVGGG